MQKKGLSGAEGGLRLEETRNSSNITGSNFIEGGNFAAYGGFTFLPHLSKVIARQGVHVPPIPN